MTKIIAAITTLLFAVSCCSGFSIPNSNKIGPSPETTTTDESSSSRRGFFSQVAWLGGATIGGFNGLFGGMQPAAAVGGLKKVNAFLSSLGVATYTSVPEGLIPLAEIYGKTGTDRIPLLVTFAHPLTWVVTLPSTDSNGEDGTIQAGEYAKGDTATFYVYNEPGHVNNIHTASKDLYEKTLIKAISQKGDNVYQNFKVTKVEPVTYDNDSKYVIVDFKYQLLTGAGFEVDRKGVASITSEGNAVEALWSASTTTRYKKTEQTLRDIVSTFRVYSEGLGMALKNKDTSID